MVVFWKRRVLKCARLEFSGCRVKPLRLRVGGGEGFGEECWGGRDDWPNPILATIFGQSIFGFGVSWWGSVGPRRAGPKTRKSGALNDAFLCDVQFGFVCPDDFHQRFPVGGKLLHLLGLSVSFGVSQAQLVEISEVVSLD